ncbi:MAG: flagellar basal body P-ring formation chaperone FlgA [Burkholderiales bacterium]
MTDHCLHRLFTFATLALALLAGPVRAQDTAATVALPTDTLAQVRSLTQAHTVVPDGARIEIEVGSLDPRLRLAPCQRIEPYLPAGQRLWGKTRIGLRCSSGPVAWNVYLPLTVHVWGRAVVAATPLAAGMELNAQDLRVAEVDLAAAASPAFDDPARLVGRRLAVAVAPLTPLRADSLRAKQWFAAGDPVSIVARGEGFAVAGEGQALSPGIEGQPVRIRVEGGRIVVGQPVGERKVEMQL